MRTLRQLFCLVAMLLICVVAFAENAYLGVNIDASKDPGGVLITSVADGSPAQKGGLLAGDVLTALGDESLAVEKPLERFRELLAKMNPGDTANFSVQRREVKCVLYVNGAPVETDDPEATYFLEVQNAKDGYKVELKTEIRTVSLKLAVVLGSRGSGAPPVPPNDALASHKFVDHANPPFYKQIIEQIVKDSGIEPNYADLLKRLAATHNSPDPFRNMTMAYVHRNPYALEQVVRHYSDGLSVLAETTDDSLRTGVSVAVELLDGTLDAERFRKYELERSVQGHIKRIQEILGFARFQLMTAFSELTSEEIDFLMEHRHGLTDAFVEQIYLHVDMDKKRLANNLRLLDIAKKIKYEYFAYTAYALSPLFEPEYLTMLREDLTTAYADKLEQPIIERFASPFGPIIIGGTGSNWYADTAAAVIIDLGGDDFYTNNSGSGSSLYPIFRKDAEGKDLTDKHVSLPLGIIIEFGGNDTYESTRPFEIGSGSVGCGVLLDLAGDDIYISRQWGQGSALFGCGMLIDASGNDTYRGLELCQGAAIFGLGMLIDKTGDDSYEGHLYCQAFAGPRGVGLLVEGDGNDRYYSKGTKPTNYGDPGIFDAWSQGCAIGFRTLASGGVALLLDRSGIDRMEAGNFSQGGGYYYGLGILVSRGADNDVYIGSRYNQGFSAHQAVGVFIDDGGNDFYITRQAVAQGLAWDECVTLFIDESGDDVYRGGTGFSIGASAHNSICIFVDKAGNDEYVLAAGPARAGGNDYHGGTSLSLFLDAEGDDKYSAEGCKNESIRVFKEHGIFADIPKGLLDALDPESLRKMLKIEIETK